MVSGIVFQQLIVLMSSKTKKMTYIYFDIIFYEVSSESISENKYNTRKMHFLERSFKTIYF